MTKKINKIIRWQICCLIFFISACTQITNNTDTVEGKNKKMAKINQAILTIQKSIQTGDIITRTGNDFTSESLRSLNQRNQTYSHCGIAIIEHDSVFIYHALGGEWNPNQKLMRETFKNFASPAANKKIGVFGIKANTRIHSNIIKTIYELYHKGITFDMDFDLKTDDKMYCAEFVAKSIEIGSYQTIHFPHSQIKKLEFIGVDDIFLHPLCFKKAEISYKL